jgi:dTMP kinase
LGLDKIACRGLVPDLTLLVEIDLLIVQAGGGFAETRMDDQEVDFHRRVREAYAELAAREPHRFTVIDGRKDPASVAGEVWEAVSQRLKRLHV